MRAPSVCLLVAFLAGASLGASAFAQDYTRIDVEYSFDNVAWAGGTATLATPSQTIYFRIRLSHTGPTPVFGLASATFQPLFTRGTAGFPISLVPLPLATLDGSGVANNSGLPANLGRLLPFAATPMDDPSPSGILTTLSGVYANEGVLRYAGANALDPEADRQWGVAFHQLSPQDSGTSFNASSSAVVFKFAASIQGTIQPVLYFVDVPYSLIDSALNPIARWYTMGSGTGLPQSFLIDPADIHPVTVWVNGNPCSGGSSGGYARSPKDITVLSGRRATFAPEVVDCGIAAYQWSRNSTPLADDARIHGAQTRRLIIDNVSPADAGTYSVSAQFPLGPEVRSAVLAVLCPADLDNGSGNGVRDQAVNINDLLYFLVAFENGDAGADLDDGRGLGLPDNAVTIDDLLYFLARFEQGC